MSSNLETIQNLVDALGSVDQLNRPFFDKEGYALEVECLEPIMRCVTFKRCHIYGSATTLGCFQASADFGCCVDCGQPTRSWLKPCTFSVNARPMHIWCFNRYVPADAREEPNRHDRRRMQCR